MKFKIKHLFQNLTILKIEKKKKNFDQKVYCAGEPGLVDELRRAGLNVVEESHQDRLPQNIVIFF